MENHTPLEEQTVRYCIRQRPRGEEKRLRELTDDFVAVTTRLIRHPGRLDPEGYLMPSSARNAMQFGVGPAGTDGRILAMQRWRSGVDPDVDASILTREARRGGARLSAGRPAKQG